MPEIVEGPKTLYDKVFSDHVVTKNDENTYLLFIDRHLVHEVTSPIAFDGLRTAGRPVRRPDCTLATLDHNIPTFSRSTYKSIETFVEEDQSRKQCLTMEENVKEFGLRYFGMEDDRQGIVHVIGPEQGFTLPGTTVVCGDSHTSTHGAFGALAFGIGTSELEHVLATQTIIQSKSKNMRVNVVGKLGPGITSKDLILHIIGKVGTAGGTGCVIEFCGQAIGDLSMESRMTMCNMAIEAGARAGMVGPDEVTFNYLKGRPLAPQGQEWENAVAYWKTLYSDEGAKFDIDVEIQGSEIIPTLTWGTSPQDALPITALVPDPSNVSDPIKKSGMERAIAYMGLTPNTPLTDIKLDQVFIGSCTNSRIEDLRLAASVVKGKKKADNVKRVIVVPGSGLVKKQAEKEGLDKIFESAGFEWREAGCSMCIGMNPDFLLPKERCASTSNRNFEGRQGLQGRTHLMSPAMAAAAAIEGHLTDARKYIVNGEAKVQFEPEKNYEQEKKPFAAVSRPSAASAVSTAVKSSTGTAEVSGIPVFKVEQGLAAPLLMANVDTDAISPKQFLKYLSKAGLGEGLFYNHRNVKDPVTGELKKTDFMLNVEPWNKAKILVVSGDNFGCGSSRETAVWGLTDFGFRSVIAPSFGDIFHNNSLKNGLLPIRLPAELIQEKLIPIAQNGGDLRIDLENQQVTTPAGEILAKFDVDPFSKYCLVNGLDDIGITFTKEAEIEKYEELRSKKFSFLESDNNQVVKPVSGAKKSTYGLKAQEW